MMKIVHYIKVIMVVIGLNFGLSHADIIDVEISGFTFVPADIKVKVGDTVRWTNRDGASHTSTSGASGVPDGIWDSGLLATDETFSYVFDTPGAFPYYCTPHTFMTGTVTVSSATISPPSGDYITTQGFDVSLIVATPTATVTGATVVFDGVDQSALFQGCSISGSLNSGGQTFRCPNIINNLTEGVHTLDMSVTLSDGTTLSDSVTWQVQATVE